MSDARWTSKLGLSLAALASTLLGEAPPVHADAVLSDPTQPPAAARVAEAEPDEVVRGEPALHGIFHADDRRFAVVDGRRVEVGDRVAGAQVVAIEVDRVRLRRDGVLVEIELVASAFKKARRAAGARTPRPELPESPGARPAPAAPDPLAPRVAPSPTERPTDPVPQQETVPPNPTPIARGATR